MSKFIAKRLKIVIQQLRMKEVLIHSLSPVSL